MKLHILNLDNDLALAANTPSFVPPQSVRQMLQDLCVLPAWWADAGDAVWVYNVARAQAFAQLCRGQMPPVRFVPVDAISAATDICPWGWNLQLARRLNSCGAPSALLPEAEQMSEMRRLSSRLVAAQLLRTLVPEEDTTSLEGMPLCGRAEACASEADVAREVHRCPRTLLKAPWSGSGKGLRQGQGIYTEPLAGWCRRILATQGHVMVEPFYTRVQDFALEFQADGCGHVSYLGLSLFSTSERGSYEGNLVASEAEKEMRLARFISLETQHSLREKMCKLLSTLVGATYRGTFGVDMMVCQTSHGLAVHPCVEINLRQTMGHVAIRLTNLLPAYATGIFSIQHFTDSVCAHPLHAHEMSLTPMADDTRFRAVLSVREK